MRSEKQAVVLCSASQAFSGSFAEFWLNVATEVSKEENISVCLFAIQVFYGKNGFMRAIVEL